MLGVYVPMFVCVCKQLTSLDNRSLLSNLSLIDRLLTLSDFIGTMIPSFLRRKSLGSSNQFKLTIEPNNGLDRKTSRETLNPSA